jgi:hypothetical protein
MEYPDQNDQDNQHDGGDDAENSLFGIGGTF